MLTSLNIGKYWHRYWSSSVYRMRAFFFKEVMSVSSWDAYMLENSPKVTTHWTFWLALVPLYTAKLSQSVVSQRGSKFLSNKPRCPLVGQGVLPNGPCNWPKDNSDWHQSQKVLQFRDILILIPLYPIHKSPFFLFHPLHHTKSVYITALYIYNNI